MKIAAITHRESDLPCLIAQHAETVVPAPGRCEGSG